MTEPRKDQQDSNQDSALGLQQGLNKWLNQATGRSGGFGQTPTSEQFQTAGPSAGFGSSQRPGLPGTIGGDSKAAAAGGGLEPNLGPSQPRSPIISWLNKLSRRERILSGLLISVIVLAVLSFLVLLPAINQIAGLNSEINSLQQQKQALLSQTDMYPEYQAQYDAAQKDYLNYRQFYYPFMDPEMIDSTVTSLLLDHSLTPVRLSMTEIGHETVSPFLPHTLVPKPLPQADGSAGNGNAADGDAASGADNSANRTPSTNIVNGSAEVPGNATVYCYTVNIEARGRFDGLLDFLEGVRDIKAIEVVSYSYDENAVGPMSGAEGGAIILTLKLYIFVDDGLASPTAGAGGGTTGAGDSGSTGAVGDPAIKPGS